MTDESTHLAGPTSGAAGAPSLPAAVDRSTFQAVLDRLRVREKAQTREADAIAAARRRLPMVEVDANLELIGPHGPLTLLDAFEGRRQLIAYYFMWYPGRPAPEQCEGCTWCTTQVAELSYVHSRDITYAVLCQGPYDESIRYRDFMGWEVPWYSAKNSLDALLVGRQIGRMHLVCYLRDDDRVFETYWTTLRGVQAMDYSYAADGPHGVRTPGGLGGLASRLATALAGRARADADERPAHRPVVPTRSGTLRRPHSRRLIDNREEPTMSTPRSCCPRSGRLRPTSSA